MSFPHNSTLRRIVAALFLLGSLSVQAQSLFACSLMDRAPATECCCANLDDTTFALDEACAPLGDQMTPGCCELSFGIVMQDTGVSASTGDRLVSQLTTPQPPPAIPVATFLVVPGSSNTVVVRDVHIAPPWSVGTDTYLVTSRLRI